MFDYSNFLGTCPAIRNLTNDIYLSVNALARYALEIYKVTAQNDELGWTGEPDESAWSSICHPISAKEFRCNVVGGQVCFSHWPKVVSAGK